MHPDRPKIVVFCGSSRFVDIMAVAAWLVERDEGAITMGLHLLPQWYSADLVADHIAEDEGVAKAMDRLHLRKIDLADEIFIVNVGHYIGESTKNEVEYALSKKKPIRWFTNDPVGWKVYSLIQAAVMARRTAADHLASKDDPCKSLLIRLGAERCLSVKAGMSCYCGCIHSGDTEEHDAVCPWAVAVRALVKEEKT